MINLFSHAKISFVVICYNREKYIAECLDSILQQPIEKEIICIDDHSTDSTFEILKQYKRKNKNIKIYQNEENLGTVITRIRGLSHCKGEFIIMVDADDQVIGDYRQLYDTAVKSDADVLEFSYEIRSDSKPRENVKLEENTFTKSESLDKYKQKTVKNVLCNKLVARKCYETFKGKLNEDIKQRNFSDVVYFMYHIMESTKRWVQTGQIGYIYFAERGMTSHISNVERLKEYCGFGLTRDELMSVYGEIDGLQSTWNIVCNQAVATYVHLSKEEQLQYEHYLYRLMSKADADFLISHYKEK